MMSKRVYLFLTGGFLLLSIGTGFAMQNRHSNTWAALQALETASIQLSKENHTHQSYHQMRALELIREAISEMKAGLTAEKPEQGQERPTT